jgi:hypothetical protein
MQCIVTYDTGKYSYQKLFLRYKFLIFGYLIIQTIYIYMKKDVMICGYFYTPKRGVREQIIFGKHWFMSTKLTSAE